jgi:hypothetical protein
MLLSAHEYSPVLAASYDEYHSCVPACIRGGCHINAAVACRSALTYEHMTATALHVIQADIVGLSQTLNNVLRCCINKRAGVAFTHTSSNNYTKGAECSAAISSLDAVVTN